MATLGGLQRPIRNCPASVPRRLPCCRSSQGEPPLVRFGALHSTRYAPPDHCVQSRIGRCRPPEPARRRLPLSPKTGPPGGTMKSNTVEQDRRIARLDELVALVRTKVAPEQRATLEAFVARYYAQVDPEDLAERQLADLYGAALSHWNFARKREPGQRARARVQSDDRGARLAVDAHDHRDRQRRHAVPRRLGDDGGQPPRPHAAPHHPSDRRRRRATPTAR